MKTALLSLLLVGCGVQVQEHQIRAKSGPNVDVQVVETVNEYLQGATENGLDVKNISQLQSIEFQELDPGVDGRCRRSFMSNNTVETSIEIAPRVAEDKTRLRVVVYHELSHCLFHAKHTPNVIGGLLSEYIVSKTSYYSQNWGKLVEQLWKEIKRQQPKYSIDSDR